MKRLIRERPRLMLITALLAAFAVGFVAGREHFRAELRDAFLETFEGW